MQIILIWDFMKISKEDYYDLSKEEKSTPIMSDYLKMFKKGDFYCLVSFIFCFYRLLWLNLLRYLLLIQKFFQEVTLIPLFKF